MTSPSPKDPQVILCRYNLRAWWYWERRELHNCKCIWCILERMLSWIPALPCESAIAYWAIFICYLPPPRYFPHIWRVRGIKPQPIHSSILCWSKRMIQQHSHTHRDSQKHTSVHMRPTIQEQNTWDGANIIQANFSHWLSAARRAALTLGR